MSVAAIKIAQKQLALPDQEYRQLLIGLTGKASSTQLTAEESRRVLHELHRRLATRPKTPTESKLWALWLDLCQYLPEAERNPEYFVGMDNRASGAAIHIVYELAELTPKQAYKAIEALKDRRDFEAAKAAPVPF